jgi:uncharacterized protein YneF (UPF0154 family)
MRIVEVRQPREFTLTVTENELREIFQAIGKTPSGDATQPIYDEIKKVL